LGRFLSALRRALAVMSLLAAGVAVACAPRPPVFAPLPVAETPGARDVVVHVRPIDTRLGSEDRRQYGVDIGAYFSAFLVSVENRTAHDLAVDLKASTLESPSGPVSEVLSDDDLVRTYRRGGMDEKAVELVAKAPAVVKRELEQLRAARMPATQLGIGGRVEGLLYFRPPPTTADCTQTLLTIRGIEILEEPQQLEFQFPLDPCGASPHEARP
jgi:hypothetical protein